MDDVHGESSRERSLDLLEQIGNTQGVWRRIDSSELCRNYALVCQMSGTCELPVGIGEVAEAK